MFVTWVALAKALGLPVMIEKSDSGGDVSLHGPRRKPWSVPPQKIQLFWPLEDVSVWIS